MLEKGRSHKAGVLRKERKIAEGTRKPSDQSRFGSAALAHLALSPGVASSDFGQPR